MADAALEFDRLVKERLGNASSQINAPPETTASQSVDPVGDFEKLVNQRLADRSTTPVNAPPQSISATPAMDMQGLFGRKTPQGEDIPLDTQTGIPVGRYWSIAANSDPESKLDYLKKNYPNSNARLLDTGDVVMEVPDSETGKPRDVILNPARLDARDLIDLYKSVPELAAGAAMFAATKGKGALKTVAQLIAGAGATMVAGEVRDIGTRALEGIPIRPADIQAERGSQFFTDLAAGAALGAVGKATRGLSPFAKSAKEGLAFHYNESAQFLKENFDVTFPDTPGIRTGNPTLMAVEAAEGKMPGSKAILQANAKAREDAVQEVAGIALGTVKTDEQAGRAAINQLRTRIVEPLENAFAALKAKATAQTDKRINKLINDSLGIAQGRISPEEAGNITSDAYLRRVKRARTAVDEAYAVVDSLPGGKGDVLSGDAAAAAAAEIRAELPGVVKDVTRPTGLVDESGKALTTTAQERLELESGKPAGLEKALSDLESLKGGQVSLRTLTNMKNAAYDAIAAFKTAHGDVKDRWFGKIASAYERGIQRGIDATEDLSLKNALANARDVYKAEMLPVERIGVRELAKGEFDAGRLTGTAIFKRMLEGDNAVANYNLLKDTLGKNSVALRALKRAWVDVKLSEATDKATGAIDADALSRSFSNLKDVHPELAQEMLGSNYQPLMQALKVRKVLDQVGVKSIGEDEMRVLLTMKDPSVADLKAVFQMSKRRDMAYVNAFFEDVKKGLPLRDFQPAKFVERLRNTDVPTEQVEAALKSMDTTTREAIATAEFYRILNAASMNEAETATRVIRGGRSNISPTRLVKAIGKGADMERTKLLLGEDLAAPGAKPPRIGSDQKGATRMDVLDALVGVTAPNEAAKTAFSALGGIGAGFAIRELTDQPLSYAARWVKNAFMATAYVKGLGRVITNRVFDPETSAAVANNMIASEPFVRGLVETFGPDTAKEIMGELKSSVDHYLQRFLDTPAGRRRTRTQQFLEGQKVPMKLEAQP